MKFLIPILIGVMAFCAYLMLNAMMENAKRKKSLRTRLAPDGTTYGDPMEEGAQINDEISARAATLSWFMRNLMGINVEGAMIDLRPKIARAGIESPDAPIYYLFFKRVLSLVIFAGAVLLMLSAKGDLLMQLVAVIVGVLGLFGPQLYVKNKTDHRTKKLMRAFPDTLDLLLICVESGLALDAALSRVCSELARAYPEMTAELNRTRLELAVLNDRVKALMNLGERTHLVAFRSLVVALIQSERFGTSLTDTLRVLSEDFRLQRLTTAEAKAARLPVIMTIPLMIFLMPALMLIILGPAIVAFANNGQAVTGK